MKKKGSVSIVLIVVVAVVLLLIAAYVGTHNNIVSLEEKVDATFSDVKVQLERRADLIPNYVNTVKGYVSHEEAVIQQITDAREKMVNADNIKDMSEANQQLTTALNSLNVVIENYPDLKADATFISLQDELSGTENRISTARRDYNEAVKQYNTTIKTIPSSIVAGMMGKTEKDYFEVSDPSKNEVPVVDFSE